MDENVVIQFLDPNCQELVNELEQFVKLRFVKVDGNIDGAQVTNRNVDGKPSEITIFYAEPLSVSGVYHELLHAKCAVLLGDNRVICINSAANFAESLFSYHNCQRLINHVEHIIIFPTYVNKGYDKNDFYKGMNYSHEEIQRFLKQPLKSPTGVYDESMVATFIDATISFMFFPIDSRFQVYLRTLKHMERDLFNIIKLFFKNVQSIRLIAEDYDKLQAYYCQYRKSIIIWVSNHPFCKENN